MEAGPPVDRPAAFQRPIRISHRQTACEKSRCQVCVIDHAAEGDRPSAWFRAGSSAVIGEDEPFDELFQTITQLLRISPPRSASRTPVASKAEPPEARRRGSRLELFARLTEREQFVLSELMEGHGAEDIAKAAFVSISTVRSQIKAILQKLGVNSQLAAVAMARRAGWSLELPTESLQKPTNAPAQPSLLTAEVTAVPSDAAIDRTAAG